MQSDGNSFWGNIFLDILNKPSHIKDLKKLLFIYLVQNAVFISISHVNTNQDDISVKTIPI